MLLILGSAAHADCTPASNLVAPHTRATWSQGGIVYDTSTDELKACDGTNYTTVSGGSTPDRIVSGSAVQAIANSSALGGYISLTAGPAGTVWGYLGSSATYLPVLNVAAISATANNSSFTTLYASGNVGIGTTAPTNTLHIAGTARFAHATSAGVYVGVNDASSGQASINLLTKGGTTYNVGNPNSLGWHFVARSNAYTAASERNDLHIYYWDGTVYQRYMTLDSGATKGIGIGDINPQVSLSIIGEVQVSNSGVTCSSSTAGAIRYTSGNLQYCNGSSFTALASGTSLVSALDDLNDAAIDYTTSYTFFVGIGAGALSKGNYVTAVGLSAADSNSGTYVTGVGRVAAYQNTGSHVTGVGHAAAYQNVGDHLTAMGSYAGYLSSGTHVTGLGTNAARQNTANYVTGVGTNAAYQNTASHVTGVGVQTAYQNSGSIVIGVGNYAASFNTGTYVTGLGYSAAYQNTANNVVAIGYEAGKNNATANQFIVKQSTVNATPLIQGDFSTGYVGIGITSPTSTLHVNGTVAASVISLTQGLYYMDTGAVEFTIGSTAATTIPLTWDHPSVDWRAYIANTDSNKFKIAYSTGSYVDVMTFTTSGLVGVGTNNPSSTFHVSGTTYLDGTVTLRNVRYGGGAILQLQPYEDLTSLNPGTTTYGGVITAPINSHLVFDLRNNGTDDAIAFRRSAANNGTVDTIGLVFRGDGHVGIGTISPTARLDVVSSTAGVAVARFQNGTGACTFTPASSGSGTWSCSSDARLKTDITDAGGRALDWIGDFRIRDYTVKADGSRQTGVIAQEVQKTHPEMVHTGADGMLTVDEPGIWKLVQALQELKADNDNLRRDLDALKRSLGR